MDAETIDRPIDLGSFCADDSDSRRYLQRPFSRDEWTYATNGKIIVRVPKREDVPEKPEAPCTKSVFALFQADAAFSPAPRVKMPKEAEDDCRHCDGRGVEHDCPDCTCDCVHCMGTGRNHEISIGVGDAIFGAKYYQLLLTLPNVMIAKPKSKQALSFRFDGGDGILMPRTRKAETHVVAKMQQPENV